jgi:hypothetical protein
MYQAVFLATQHRVEHAEQHTEEKIKETTQKM